MNQTKIFTSGNWLIEENQQFSSVTIHEGAVLSAPENHYLTLTVNGIGRTIRPGTYNGEVVFTVAENFTRTTLRFGEETVSNFHAGAIIDGDTLVERSSVPAIIQGGPVTASAASDITIESREWDFNGFYITGDSEYTIDNLNMLMVGDGTDDFVGMGAGIAVTGTANVTVNNSTFRTEGIGRGTFYVGGDAEVTLNDCYVSTFSQVPTEQELQEGMKQQRMMEPPWAIGLRGNGRTLNLAANGKIRINHSHITSNSWGVLSVDGARVNRMYVKDSLIEITGSNGYGCFCICDDFMFDYKSLGEPGCIDVIDHTFFEVPYTGVLMSLGNGNTEFKNGSIVNSGRFGAFVHRNSGGKLAVNSGSVINAKEAIAVVKGSNTYFDFDNAVLNSASGVILQLQDNDDVGMGPDTFFVPVGIEDTRDNRDLTVAIPNEDVFVRFANMSAAGNLFNSTTNIMACNRRVPWDADPAAIPDRPMPPVGEGEPSMAPPEIEIPLGPDGLPVLRGFTGTDLMGAKNLAVKLENANLSGQISSAKAAYADGLTIINHDNCEELSHITQTPAAPVNNGVIVSVDADSVWTVTGESYLTSLTLEPGGVICAPEGKKLIATLNGEEIQLNAGTYTGTLRLTVC